MYDFTYDIVGFYQRYRIRWRKNLRYRMLYPVCCQSYTTSAYDVAYNIDEFDLYRIRCLRVTLVKYEIVGDIRDRRSTSAETYDQCLR
jgi:hypothetical protein